ncbi:MAG: DMT family transporter [Planctomycetota bacterium]
MDSGRQTIRKGLIYGAVASLLWSLVPPIGRLLSSVDTVYLVTLRFLMAGLVLMGILAATRRLSALREAAAHDLPRMALLGLTGIFGMGLLLFASLRYTISVNAGILANANPIFIVLLAVCIGERITIGKISGIAAGVLGCVLVIASVAAQSAQPPENNLLGCALAVGAAFSWAVFTVAGKGMVRKYGGMATTTLATLCGGVMLLVVMLLRRTPLVLDPIVLGWIAFIGIVPTALGFFLWYHALETVEAGRLGPLQFIAPVGAAAIGALFLGEEITRRAVLGMVLVFLGIYCSSIRGAEKEIPPKGEPQT